MHVVRSEFEEGAARLCSRCKVPKPASREHFSFIASRNTWHSWCKPCCAEDRRRDRSERPDRYAEIDRRRREKDPELVRRRNRESYWRTREQRLADLRNRSAERRARANAARRLKYASDPEYAARKRAACRALYAVRQGLYRARARERWASAGPDRRLRNSISAAMSHSVKGSTRGGTSWERLVGYDTATLKRHLERQFARGMSWSNYGRWHIDHIIPVAHFRIRSVKSEAFQACWSLSNLRPLWARDNIAKRAKRVHLL